jgi:chromosome segregation ATPase
MDTSEATQLLTWLDEEHRRDKAMLAELQKGMEQHEGHLSNVTERMEKLEERLAQTNAELARMSRFEQALQKFKDEILLELRGSEERLREEVDNKEKLLREERQERAKGLTKLAARVEEAFQFGDQLQTQQAELQRLNKAISALKLQIDEALKEGKKPQEKLLVLAERLNKSDEKLTELVEEGEEEKVRSEGIKEKLKGLEGWAERGTQQMVDLQTFGERLREEQAQSVEQLRAVDDRRAKRIAAWAREMGSWRKEAEKLREQPALIEKWHRSAERTLAALDELKSQLEQDREVLEHLQETGEERQKQQLEEWRKENEMLWLRNDERWQQLSVENDKRDARITHLWESQAEYLRRQVRELAKWIKEFEKRLVRSKK